MKTFMRWIQPPHRTVELSHQQQGVLDADSRQRNSVRRSYDNNVYTLDAVKGTEQWTTPPAVSCSPHRQSSTALPTSGSEDGNLYALHADDSVPIISEYTVSNPSNQNVTARFEFG